MLNKATDFEEFYARIGITVPERSELYSLEPIGLGTPMMECLTSYIFRLACAHRVSVRELMKLAIRNCSKRDVSDSNRKHLNGCGSTPYYVIEGLEKLTMRRDIRYLGTQHWEGFIQHGYIRKQKAWCSLCFNEWRSKKILVYEPLIWHVNHVSICYKHNIMLQTECSSCGNEQPVLDNTGQMGVCFYCTSFLGEIKEEPSHCNSKEELLAAECVADLIVNAKDLEELSQTRYIKPHRLKFVINRYIDDQESPFQLLKRWTTFYRWD